MLYGKIPHLPGSRTGPADRHVGPALAARLTRGSLPGDVVTVQEKLDGSCVALVRAGGEIVAYGREGRLCAASPNEGRRAFAAWARENAGRFASLAEGDRLVCEWLSIAHGTRYALPHEPVVLLDAFRAGAGRSPLADVRRLAAAAGLPVPHVVHEGAAIPVEEALARLGERGFHGALDPAEGLVFRVEARGAPAAIAKFVRQGKVDGAYLADHTGRDPVWNTWRIR